MLQASFKSENPAKVMYFYKVHDSDLQKTLKIQILNAPQDQAPEALGRYEYSILKIQRCMKVQIKLLITYWIDNYNQVTTYKYRKRFEIRYWSAPRNFLAIIHDFFSDFPFCTYSWTKV